MLPFRTTFLILSSFLLAHCTPVHKQMQAAQADVNRVRQFQPAFGTALYNTTVDVTGNHLSGLLMIKRMPDSSVRIVFSSEMGLGFFDFEFRPDGDFKVHSIIKKMNRKAVIKTLRHDFELVLMNRLDYTKASVRSNKDELYFIFPQEKGFNYYVTDPEFKKLIRMERASNKKVIVKAVVKDMRNGIPDSIGIAHQAFEFNIGLKRIER